MLTLIAAVEILGCHGSDYYANDQDLTSVPVDIPPKSTRVYLQNNRIRNLESGVFSQLSVCIELDMSYNRLSNIERGSFRGLDTLYSLNLQRNYLQNLVEGTFEGLISCTELDLRENYILSITSGAFDELNRLTTLNLYNNALRQINSTMWTGLPMLETLNLEHNDIETISPEALSSLIYLETLNLKWNDLFEINGNMWVGLQSLKHLDLSHNSIAEIPRHGFSNLSSLETLNLNALRYRTLSSDIFNPDDNPDSDGRPPCLKLLLAGYRLQCDTALCWLKEAVETGSVYFPSDGLPRCHNLANVPFEAVTLDCTAGKYCIFRPIGSLQSSTNFSLKTCKL